LAWVKRERWGLLAVAAAAALFVWAMARHVSSVAQHSEGLDFQDYYFSAKAVLRGKSVYDHQAMVALARGEVGTTGLPPYVYPPLLTVLFVPLTLLAYPTARMVWLALDQILLAAAIVACARICAERGARMPGALFCATFALLGAAAFAPMIDHDWQGQSNTLVLALSVWALYAHLKRTPSDLWTGALLAPAILLKVFPGIFVPYLLLRRRWAAALWAGAAGVVVTALSLVVVSWSDYLRFPHVLADSMYLQEGGGTLANYSMPAGVWWVGSLVGAREGIVRVAAAVVRYLPYPLALGAAAWEARREASLQGIGLLVPVLRMSQAFLLMGFLILKWWEHHLVFALVPLFFAVRLAFFERAAVRIPGAVAALVVVSALWIALPRHPLLWEAMDAPRWAGVRDALVETKRLGILLLLAATEACIWRLKRTTTVQPSG
jgi:alpha-1,2-mannosyltransferase